MDRFLQDLRYGVRMLRRAPGPAAVALITLAFATGLSTSIFTLVNAISLRPLPYDAPHELLQISSTHRETGAYSTLSAPDALDLRARSRTLAELVIYEERQFGVRLAAAAAAEEVIGSRTSGHTFRMLGVGALLGRTLLPEDESAAAPSVVVISHQLWRNRFGQDAQVLGRTLRIDGVPHDVIGVMPDRFGFHDFAEFWVPVRETELGDRATRRFHVMARHRPEFTPQQVAQELAAIHAQLAAAYPATNAGWETRVRRVEGNRREPFIYALVVAALFVLLIACANVGNLLLARGAARRAELAVRLMVGASRARVLRQLITESVVLAVIGTAAGVLVSLWGIDLLVHSIPLEQLPLWIDFGIDGRVLAFTVAALAISVVTFGVLPALSLLRDDIAATAQQAGRRAAGGVASTRTRNTLVVAELALALVLLASASLLLKGTVVSAQASPGFDPEPILHVSVPLNAERYASEAARAAYLEEAARALQALDNVESVGVTAGLPASSAGPGAAPTLGAVSVPDATGVVPRTVLHTAVSPAFFATLQLPVLRGRGFAEGERGNAVILSHALAERLWPGGDPIGRSIRLGPPDAGTEWLTVVGVVGDRYRIATGQGGEPRSLRLDVYLPAGRGTHTDLSLLIRARGGSPSGLAAPARDALQRIDPDQPIVRVEPYADIVYDNVEVLRWVGGLAGMFAVAALALSAIGLFGVIAYSVAQRTREIGIRVALGARPDQVVRMVTGTGARLALIGVGIGLLLTLASGRLLRSVIFGVSPYHPLVLASVALALGSIAVLASWWPARRAARVSPLVALQAE